MKLGDKLWHKRLPDWEPFDMVTIEVKPRLKTSGMSGDEWRTGVAITLWFKGEAIVEEFRTSLDWSLKLLPSIIAEHTCPFPQKVIEIERECCDQPSCAEKAVSRYKLKRLFSDQGDALDMSEKAHADYYRQFCRRHLYRGDCSREDCDDNYEVISGPGPNDSMEHPEDESPAQQVVVQVDSMDDIPAEIAQVTRDQD